MTQKQKLTITKKAILGNTNQKKYYIDDKSRQNRLYSKEYYIRIKRSLPNDKGKKSSQRTVLNLYAFIFKTYKAKFDR